MKTAMASNMKHIGSVALMFAFGVATVYAQSVKMTFSGTAGNSSVDVPYNYAIYDEDNFAGTGTLGSFTLRNERQLPSSPTSPPPGTCSGPDDLYFVEPAGAGVFRFQDGSLLYVNIAQATDCVNVVTNGFQCVLPYQIQGGTGRFKNASGTLRLTETGAAVAPLSPLLDAVGNALYSAATGNIKGEISGVSEEQN